MLLYSPHPRKQEASHKSERHRAYDRERKEETLVQTAEDQVDEDNRYHIYYGSGV